MDVLSKISFIGYLIVAIGMGLNGVTYVFAKRIMSYHLEAMETSLEKMSRGMQIMSLSFMKSAGAGMISSSIAIIFILFSGLGQRGIGSIVTLFLITISEIGIVTSRVCMIRKYTKGKPPIGLSIGGCIVTVLSFVLALLTQA